MRHWKLDEAREESPAILHSREGEARVVVLSLARDQMLGEHQVHESALLLVVEGDARIEAGGEAVDATAGELFRFDPAERHTVTTSTGALLLLVLAPWPGEGHYQGDEAVSASA
ncbi:MAG TPA: cupin domain-containing protein [Gaiellaceae bacterium]|nr:cupin domain-containing protein [Gaiellaceae bacterium]